jgi:hypothetical protein
MTVALQAAVSLIAFGIARRLGLPCPSSGAVCRRLGVARSHAYEQRDKLAGRLEGGLAEHPCTHCLEVKRELRLKAITIAVLEYRATHPGAWGDGERTVYSAGLRAFVLGLAKEHGDLEQADFAEACGIPLPTLKAWWTDGRRPDAPWPERPTPVAPSNPSPPASPPHETNGLGSLPLEMLRVVAEYERWEGTLQGFVAHLNDDLKLHYGRAQVTQILHLAAVRKILKKPPPKPPTRGSTFRPPPGVQWTSDGKEVKVVVDERRYVVAWQPMVDVGCTATVGEAVRPEEDAAGVVTAFEEGVATTGAPPQVLLLDNKAPNRSEALRDALPDATTLMHATRGRPENKAVIEGGFGLFAQELGPVVAVVSTSTPERTALDVAEAVTRAYATGRNHRPRRQDGKTPYELYRDRDRSPEKIAAAVEFLRAIKERIDERDEREAARRDPYVRAVLEDAFARFGFTDEGDLLSWLATLSREAVQSAIAIFAAKRAASSLPADAGLRYFAGIARNRQHELELWLYEVELVSLLEREGQLVTGHLERKATELASLDLAPRLGAIVHELLTVPAPVAQVFWRRHFASTAAAVSQHLRAPLRRWLCTRVRRFFRAAKQLRQELLALVIRALPPEPLPTPSR